jgi:uncharacterized membrane-anchored protein YitT (DUF2179 family)
MKKRSEKLKAKFNNYLYNHIWLKYVVEYSITLLMCILSAVIFAFGLKVFLAPDVSSEGFLTLVSGGASGLAQIISLVVELIAKGVTGNPTVVVNANLIYSIAYVVINIPIVILAFKGIGIRFGTFTLLNILCVSLCVNFVNLDFLNEMANFVSSQGGLLARALFAGLCTGVSSAIAFKFEISAGGIDVISYYFSIKKSSNVGKYGVIMNSIIVSTFAILTALNGGSGIINPDTGLAYNPWAIGLGGLFFSIVYMFTVMLVVDSINVRNKKVQLQIITNKENLHDLLLANIPHGATIVNGKGAFSGTDKIIIYMVVSQFETRSVIKLIREVDPDSFINVTNLQQVYGRFFIKPVK